MRAHAPARPVAELEKTIQSRHVGFLEAAGFHTCSLSQRRAVHGGLISFPDVIAFYQGHTILIEEKASHGKVRPGQKIFSVDISAHTGDHLHYLLRPTDDELWNLINKIRGLKFRY